MVRSTSPVGDEQIPVTDKRKVIAERLVQSKFSAPHYHLRSVVTMDGLLQARASLNASRRSADMGDRISLNAFFIKFAALALARNQGVNATWQGRTILRHGSIDIALAVAQPDGLITPVVRDCASRGIVEIHQELSDLIQRALANRLLPEEYTGSTFTISNLGSFGIHDFTAIINPPGSAILAVGEARTVPRYNEAGELVPRSEMILSLSCDHRVIDGAVGAAFMKDLRDLMENPITALY